MAFSHRTVKTNGIDMHVAEIGEGKPVVFVHGFPELWRSWHNQMPAVADAGYRAVAPDMRGYGRTTAPAEVDAYSVQNLTGDLCGLLDDLGVEKALFVGHDWGAWAMWFMCLLHPDRVEALCNLSVAYAPRSAGPPIQMMRQIFGENFFYQIYFQEVGPADAELGRDPRKTVRRFAWSVSGEAAEGRDENALFQMMPAKDTGFLDQMADPPAGKMAWFTKEDEDYFVEEFSRTGYFGPLSWYRNIDRNWETTPELADAKVMQPVLFIAGAGDPVIRMLAPDGMRETVPNLKGIDIVPGAGHWIHMEKPDEVNTRLLKFISDVGY